MDTIQLMLAVAVFAVVWAIGFAFAEWAVDEARLRRIRAAGYAQTYGVTGDVDDLHHQIADLRKRHELIAVHADTPTIRPIPARKKHAR